MGLYLTVFDEDAEVDGIDVGAYADFDRFRQVVTSALEPDGLGSRFPMLMLHSDCDGEWSPVDAVLLERELQEIATAFQKQVPIPLTGWQRDVAKTLGLRPRNLYECFFDVDGEPLIERLMLLAQLSQSRQLPILFQ